jgi:hypothetical protein
MKRYPGINYDFSPESYWLELDPLAAIIKNVKGERRRQLIREAWKAGLFEDLAQELISDELPESPRTQLSRIHPSFMGGEYLPDLEVGEVEIARICLRSTTADVISLLAAPCNRGISYRIVDEYEEMYVLPIAVSAVPLSLADVIRQLDEANDPVGKLTGGASLGFNIGCTRDCARSELRNFTRISSIQYPELETHYEDVFDDWVAQGTK